MLVRIFIMDFFSYFVFTGLSQLTFIRRHLEFASDSISLIYKGLRLEASMVERP